MSHELQSAIVGATGYAGQELARILFQHPRLKPPVLLAREGEEAGEIASPVDGSSVPVHPFSWSIMHKKGVDLLFLATPHEVSRAWVPTAMAHGLRVIDLSGAWRLHAPENAAVYGFDDAGSADGPLEDPDGCVPVVGGVGARLRSLGSEAPLSAT